MAAARQHINKRGDVRWQPILDDGDRLWRSRGGNEWAYDNDGYGFLGPKLYKNKERALRVAKRREYKEAGWFREVNE